MRISPRILIYSLIFISLTVLLYSQKEVLMPFFLAAGFAYILNPIVNFLSHKIRLPRTLSILLIYLVIISSLVYGSLIIGVRLSNESQEFSREAKVFTKNVEMQIKTLPDWVQGPALDGAESARASVQLLPRRALPYFPGALTKSISLLVFLFAAFYFLKDGKKFFETIEKIIPSQSRVEVDIIVRKINQVLGNYLRAQLLLVIIMSALTFVGLSFLGVRYALVLSIFIGFAEIIPFLGPLFISIVAALVTYFDGVASLGLPPVSEVLVVIAFLFILRQIQDLFITPQVMGRLTKLHPLIILTSVLIGGHIFGVVGFLIAVPLVASGKIVLEYLLEKSLEK